MTPPICECGCERPLPVPSSSTRRYATQACRMRGYRASLSAEGKGPTPHQQLRKSVWWLAADPCAYCGEASSSLDHITPHDECVRPGSLKDPWHDWTNLTAACKTCNNSKKRRTLLGFLYARMVRDELVQAARGISIGQDRTVGVVNVNRTGAW